MEGYKTCCICEEMQPVRNFNKNRSKKDGLAPRCKACLSAYNRAYRKANREKLCARKRAYDRANAQKVAASNRAYRKANASKINTLQRRRMAKKKGNGVYKMLDKELQRLYASPCVTCGATENIHRDHIIPIARGGTDSIGNSQPLCGPCNLSKNDKLPIEWRVWLEQSARSSVGAA